MASRKSTDPPRRQGRGWVWLASVAITRAQKGVPSLRWCRWGRRCRHATPTSPTAVTAAGAAAGLAAPTPPTEGASAGSPARESSGWSCCWSVATSSPMPHWGQLLPVCWRPQQGLQRPQLALRNTQKATIPHQLTCLPVSPHLVRRMAICTWRGEVYVGMYWSPQGRVATISRFSRYGGGSTADLTSISAFSDPICRASDIVSGQVAGAEDAYLDS